jgi:hypothetical protein
MRRGGAWTRGSTAACGGGPSGAPCIRGSVTLNSVPQMRTVHHKRRRNLVLRRQDLKVGLTRNGEAHGHGWHVAFYFFMRDGDELLILFHEHHFALEIEAPLVGSIAAARSGAADTNHQDNQKDELFHFVLIGLSCAS